MKRAHSPDLAPMHWVGDRRPTAASPGRDAIPATLAQLGAGGFGWLWCSRDRHGFAAAALTFFWGSCSVWCRSRHLTGRGTQRGLRHILVLLEPVATGAGQIVCPLSSATASTSPGDLVLAGPFPFRTSAAPCFRHHRRHGASLGREGRRSRPAVIANALSDRGAVGRTAPLAGGVRPAPAWRGYGVRLEAPCSRLKCCVACSRCG